MLQIRRGVFETNSSSMHSLTVMKRDAKYTPEEILEKFYLSDDRETGEEDSVWNIFDEDNLYFGRYPFRILRNFHDKWLYAVASLVKEYKDEIYNELESIALKYVPGLKKIKLPTTIICIPNLESDEEPSEYRKKYGKTEKQLIEFLSEKTEKWGIEARYWKNKDGSNWLYEAPEVGRVDEDILSGFLKKENVSLEEFLTNSKYVVIQDGDEYCEWDNVKKSGLIDVSKIDHEYPKY